MNEKGKVSISTIILLLIIIATIVFIVIIAKTGDQGLKISAAGVDFTDGVTYDKQVALSVNTNLKSYMDMDMSYATLMTLINVAKSNNNSANSSSDNKVVYFKYQGEILIPEELITMISKDNRYSASLNNSDKSDDEKDDASYYTNGQIKLIEVKQL